MMIFSFLYFSELKVKLFPLYILCKIFTDIIKLGISRQDHPRLYRWLLNPMTGVFKKYTEERHREKGERLCEKRGQD